MNLDKLPSEIHRSNKDFCASQLAQLVRRSFFRPLSAVILAQFFLSLELSRSTWLIPSLSPGNGEKMPKHLVAGGNVAELLDRFEQLKQKAWLRTGRLFPNVTIREAGLDGFWIHRVLEAHGIGSYIVDAASIATSRPRRRVKTDKIGF